MKKMIIAGGSGFLGKVLINYFKNKYSEIIILTRGKTVQKENLKFIHWDAKTLTGWEIHLENACVIVNLVGKSVDCRYNSKNKQEIRNSRIDATGVLQQAITKCKNPPLIWLNASTATIYTHSETKPMTEESGETGDDFSMNVAKKWEAAFFKETSIHTRKVALRTSIVLGTNGGAFKPLKNMVRMGFGGKQGNGKQMVSWIHEVDFARIVAFIIAHPEFNGVVNVTAPNPLQNRKLMKCLRASLRVPLGINIPTFLLEIGAFIIRTETELVLKSRYVVPERLEKSGFVFKYPTVQKALQNLLRQN